MTADTTTTSAAARRPREYVRDSGPSRSATKPTPMDPVRVHFSPAWLAAGAAGAGLALAAVARLGRPAALALGALGAATLGHMVLGEPARPRLERHTLWLPQLPPELAGLRVGQISDIHLGTLHSAANLRWAVAQMQREQPDLIVLTGDQVMRRESIPELAALLRGLSAPLGVYAIPGNHDHWEGLRDVRAALSLAGIPMLLNEHRQLRWRGGELWLLGVDDIWDGELDLDQALRGVPEGGFRLLLGHVPDMADMAERRGIHLQLAGHVHGGHLRLPLLGPFVRPRYGTLFLDGLYHVGAMQLYVSRGLGGAPLRLLCPPEAAILTLRRA